MKRKRERAKLANGDEGAQTSDAIVETTSASSLSLTKRKKKKIMSDDRRTNSDLVPIDLLMEILKRLPVKTLARFMCVSKLWASIIRRRDFKKLFLTESSKRQGSNLIFTFERDKGYGEDCFFFSSLQTKNPCEASVAATYHTTYPVGDFSKPMAPTSVHGLICYGPPSEVIVYNPSTRRSITLPKIDSQSMSLFHFLGYDPIDGDYKMLCMTRGRKHGFAKEVQVLTLGNGNSWRMIEDCPPHSPESLHICIDGVLYYAYFETGGKDRGVMSFDVRSEKFDVIKVPPGRATKFTSMTRYNGKLALMCTLCGRIGVWVLEDAAKHEWSSMFFALPRLARYKTKFQVFCVTDDIDACEFVLAPRALQVSPFFVLYYDPKKKSVRKVDIEGITEQEELPLWDKDWERRTMSIFPGQVGNLMFL